MAWRKRTLILDDGRKETIWAQAGYCDTMPTEPHMGRKVCLAYKKICNEQFCVNGFKPAGFKRPPACRRAEVKQ